MQALDVISRIDIHISLKQNNDFKADILSDREIHYSTNAINYFHNKDDNKGNNSWRLLKIKIIYKLILLYCIFLIISRMITNSSISAFREIDNYHEDN